MEIITIWLKFVLVFFFYVLIKYGLNTFYKYLTEIMYTDFMNKFQFGKLKKCTVHLYCISDFKNATIRVG